MLETIRAYALDKLAENGEAELVARRHAEFFRGLLMPAMAGPLVAADDLPGYVREIDNLRAALDWAFSDDRGDLDIGIGLIVAAVPVFPALSQLPECHRWTERALLALDEARRGTSEEMRLQSGLGYSLMFTRGGGDAARAALDRSLTIAEDRGDVLYQMWLLTSLNMFHFRNGNFRTALHYARRCSAVAAVIGNPAAVALAQFFLGNTLHVVGDLGGSRAELEAAVQHRSRIPRTGEVYFSFDTSVPAAMSLANTLCLQGRSSEAVELARRTLDQARHIEHAVTLSIVLRHAAMLFLWIGDLQTAEEVIDWYTSDARSHSLVLQAAVGRGLKAELAIRRGDAQTGVEILQACVEELRAARYGMMTSPFNLALAEGLAAIGRFDESMRVIDDGIRQVEANGDAIYMPELLRVRGVVLFAMPEPRIEEAEADFIASLELSRRQGAHACELRTAIDLSKLMAAQGRRQEACALLEPVFAGFDVGPETADLKSAECLLATLR